MDVLTKEQRRRNMQAIKSCNSKIEILLGRALWHNGFRYRKNDKEVFGKPDFVFRKQKVAIFCDGDFWHGKDWQNQQKNIKSRRDFWIPKIERNIQRDKEVNIELEQQGWKVVRFWESEIKKNLPECVNMIRQIMSDKKDKDPQKEITIEEICNGKKVKMQIYGPHSLNDDGTIMPFNDQMAIVTHYLQNQNTKYAKPFENKAKGLIEDIYRIRFNNTKEYLSHVAEAPIQYNLFKDTFSVPFPGTEKAKFTFIDLFAGIGGFRLAMQNLGGKCVYSSEWNEYAQKTYLKNFGEVPFGDITKESVKQFIPDNFDLLCAGFPCQPFSIAGVSKKISLGRAHGFKDKAQGTLFFDVAKILETKRPKAFFLENVKNLVTHDKRNTFRVIKGVLEELGYSFHSQIIDGKYFVPQHRERIMMVGFDKEIYSGKEEFSFPELTESNRKFREILDKNVDTKYTLSDKLWNYLQEYALKHKQKGNGFGFGLTNMDGISRTLSARYYKDGAEILVPQENSNPRRLTPRECARLQGYPDTFDISAVSDNQAYKQFGNSVVVPLIQAVGNQIVNVLKK